MTQLRRTQTLAPLVLGVALLLGGCADSNSVDFEVEGDVLTVYTSVPLQGARKAQGEAIVNGAKLALADADGRAGRFRVNAVYLDDTRGRPARWDPVTTADNARRASQDTRAIAFIGDLDAGATRVSLPIVNQAGIAQVTLSTGVDLTRAGPGTGEGEPERYYPTERRTLVRVVPADDVQARAAARWARDLRPGRVLVFSDGSGFARGLAAGFSSEAGRLGLATARARVRRVYDDRVVDVPAGAERSRLVYYAGSGDGGGLEDLRVLLRNRPGATLMASDALLDPGFLAPLGPLARLLHATSPVLPADRLGRAGRRFAAAYELEFGRPPDPYAAYGYEAMALVLHSIRRAGKEGSDRREMAREMLHTLHRRSVLGTYSIDPETGDTSLDRIAGYRIRRGRPVFDRLLSGR